MKPTTKPKQRDYLDTLIVAVRDRELTFNQICRRLRILRAQLHNRRASRGRRTAPPTWAKRNAVHRLRQRRPELSMQEISQRLSISIGRVSEILRGKRR